MGSRHFSEGGYDRIATKLFQDLNVHTYYLNTTRRGRRLRAAASTSRPKERHPGRHHVQVPRARGQ